MMNKKIVNTILAFLPFYSAISASAESTTHVFDDWSVNCLIENENSQKSCAMTQRGIDNQTGQTVFQLLLNKESEKKLGLEVLVPLGVKLQAGVEIQVEKKKLLNIPFEACVNKGCVAKQRISQNQQKFFIRGSTGVVLIKDLSNNEVKLPFSLNGFQKALNKLQTMK